MMRTPQDKGQSSGTEYRLGPGSHGKLFMLPGFPLSGHQAKLRTFVSLDVPGLCITISILDIGFCHGWWKTVNRRRMSQAHLF